MRFSWFFFAPTYPVGRRMPNIPKPRELPTPRPARQWNAMVSDSASGLAAGFSANSTAKSSSSDAQHRRKRFPQKPIAMGPFVSSARSGTEKSPSGHRAAHRPRLR